MEPRHRNPFLKRSAAAQGSKTSPNSRVYRDFKGLRKRSVISGGEQVEFLTEGMNRRKKVKFADSPSARELRCKQDAPSLKMETMQSPSSDGAKTSEYKYFKRLREETAHKCHSHQVPMQEINLKTSKARDGVEKFYNTVTCKFDMSRPILPIQNITPIVEGASFTPAKVTENCRLNSTVACKNDADTSLFPIRSVTPISRRSTFVPAKVSWKCGQKYEHGGIFTEKRSKLLQLVAESLSLEIDELLLNRSNSIFKFLNRLGNGRTSSNHKALTKSVQKVLNDRCQSPVASKFDGPFERVLDSAGKDFFPATSRKHSRKDLLAHKCKKADDCISFPLGYTGILVSPTWHDLEAGFQCNKRSDWVLDGAGSSDMHAENRSMPVSEWSTAFEDSRNGYHEIDHMLPKVVYPIPKTFSAYHPFTWKFVPYTKRTSIQPCDFHDQELHLEPVKEQYTPLLLGWNEDTEEPELSFGSEREMDRLPLTLYTAPNFFDQTNLFESTKIFDFSSGNNCLVLPDTSRQSLNGFLSTPMCGFELEWKSLPPVDRMFESSPTGNQEMMLQVTPHQNLDDLFWTSKHYCELE